MSLKCVSSSSPELFLVNLEFIVAPVPNPWMPQLVQLPLKAPVLNENKGGNTNYSTNLEYNEIFLDEKTNSLNSKIINLTNYIHFVGHQPEQ